MQVTLLKKKKVRFR